MSDGRKGVSHDTVRAKAAELDRDPSGTRSRSNESSRRVAQAAWGSAVATKKYPSDLPTAPPPGGPDEGQEEEGPTKLHPRAHAEALREMERQGLFGPDKPASNDAYVDEEITTVGKQALDSARLFEGVPESGGSGGTALVAMPNPPVALSALPNDLSVFIREDGMRAEIERVEREPPKRRLRVFFVLLVLAAGGAAVYHYHLWQRIPLELLL